MWDRDPVCEQLLGDVGIKSEYKTGIPIAKLRVKESKRLNVRPNETLDESMCNRYSYDMKRGIRFPAICIREDNIIIAGIHRIEAAQRAGFTSVDAYILKGLTQQQEDEFIRRDNARHGKTLTEEVKISTCVELHRKYGTKLTKLCNDFFGGEVAAYNKMISLNWAYEVREQLETQGVAARNIPQSALATLYKLRENTNVLREAGIIAAQHALTQTQCDELVKKVNAKGTEAEKLVVVTEMRAELTQKARSGTRKVNPVKALKQTLARVRSALLEGNGGKKFPEIDKMTEDKEERKTLKEEVNEIINILKNIK